MRYGAYRFNYIVTKGGWLPAFKGSTLRGVFGHSLKKAVCAVRNQECGSCILSSKCLYARTLEPQPHDSGGDRHRVAMPPHPYVLVPPGDRQREYLVGAPLVFELILFGSINDYLPYFVFAAKQMGERGLGSVPESRVILKLATVEAGGLTVYKVGNDHLDTTDQTGALELDQPSDEEGRLFIELLTPLRLKQNNRFQIDLPFHLLIRAALRRISSLFNAHGDGEPNLDYRGLIHRAKSVATEENHLQWIDLRRYSNRQRTRMLLGGIIGTIVYRGQLGEFIPLIEAARVLHIGKQTTFGLGKLTYSWEPDV